MKTIISQTVVEILEGDITEMDTEAIVNAANSQLILGAGVAGAIKRKGGPSIQEECNSIGGIQVGGAVATGGGNLKARYVIHAVGPRMGEGDEDRKLASAVKNSLAVAREHQIKSIAFPAISTGIFGFPIDRAASIMLGETEKFLKDNAGSLERVVFCLFGRESYDTFGGEFTNRFLS